MNWWVCEDLSVEIIDITITIIMIKIIVIIIIITIIIIIIIIIIIFIYLTSKIYNSAVNEKKMLIKFDEKKYWFELLIVSNISYKP